MSTETTTASTAEIIVRYDVTEGMQGSTFGELAMLGAATIAAAPVGSTNEAIAAQFLDTCYSGELDYAADKIGAAELEQVPVYGSGLKKGRKKLTKILPGTYCQARSLINSCIEDGIPLLSESGSPRGKSELEDARRALIASRDSAGSDDSADSEEGSGLSADDKLRALAGTVASILASPDCTMTADDFRELLG